MESLAGTTVTVSLFFYIHIPSTHLQAPANGQVESTYTDLGAEALYHCDTGYELFGNDTRTCNANASWSGNLPQCHRE